MNPFRSVGQKGFTLLEVMIAITLLAVILSSVFIAQTSSLSSSGRSKNVLIATNLARNLVNEKELAYEGVPFDRLDKAESGSFAAPYSDHKWTITIEEVDFSVLGDLMRKQAEEANATPEPNQETVIKLFQDYLNRSVRRMTVKIEWPEAGSTSNLTFTELLVNYDAEFATGI